MKPALYFFSLQYHIGKVSLTEQLVETCPAMDDLDSALQCLEVKMEAESSAEEMLVHINYTAAMDLPYEHTLS